MREQLKKVKPRHVAFGGIASAGSMLVYRALENPETVSRIFGEAASNQIIQAGFFFSVAAWLHSKQVNKSISENFASLTEAINNVADSFKEDLKKHSDEIANLANRVKNVEDNLNSLKENKS